MFINTATRGNAINLDKDEVKRRLEALKPLPGNRCREEGCEGHVERQVIGVGPGGYMGHFLAKCNACNHSYPLSGNVPLVGHERVRDMMRIRFTV